MLKEHKSKARTWSKKDIEELLKLKEQGLNRVEIAKIINRTEDSVAIKLKRLKKKTNEYNTSHYREKTEINKEFEEYIKPKTILDLYAGENKNYKCKKITTNDINEEYETDYHRDALELLGKLYYEKKKYDYIDLDPFGSAYECFDIAIKMATKGIAITFGELGHVRFKRIDYVRTRYNINSLEEFTLDNMIKKIQEIGIQNKKELIVYEKREWKNIGRVWFVIKPYKIKIKIA